VALAGSTIQASGNHLDRGQAGIVVSDATTHATLDGNTITGQAKDGIYIQKGAAATVANNALQAIAGNGITVTDGPGTGTIRGNTLRAIARDGIALYRGAVDPVTGNVITEAGNVGIVVAANATVTSIADNQVSGGKVGMRLADGGTRAQIAGNSVHGQSEAGIWVLNGAVAETTDNTLVGPGTASTATAFGPAGIHYASGAAGAIRGNRISNYRSDRPGSMACGIAIDRDTGAVAHSDNTFPPPGNASDLCQGAPPEFWQPGKATVAGTPVP
jgi:parallel beta-helix repeat protein